jgi:hypothetical protein
MPIKLATKVQAPSLPKNEADIFEITGFDVLLESAQVRVYWEARATGTDAAGKATVTVVVPRRADVISFAFALTEVVPTGLTYYQAIKDRLYKAMQDGGHFPAGPVT